MLNFQLFTAADDGEEIVLPARPQNLTFSTNRHGFAACSCFVPVVQAEAFRLYDAAGTPQAVISDRAAEVIWEGRLEDRAIVPDGVRLGAFGYWRALHDVPYTALWSRTTTAGWRAVTSSDQAAHTPEKYEMDNNNRLFITLKKGETYVLNQLGGIAYQLPHLGQRNIAVVSFDYDITLPNSSWVVQTRSYTAGFGTTSTEDTITGTGANQTGSKSITFTAGRPIVDIAVRWNAGGSYNVTAETGAWYVRITNVRIKSTTTSPLTADLIADDLASFINGINPGQLAADTALITATSEDLSDELYEDALPADILDRLARLHNYEVGVWEGRELHFRERGSAGRQFFVDVTQILDLQRSLDNLRNSVYATYRDANGRTLRTAVTADAASVARWDITRRGLLPVQTTSATEAEAHRDVFLSERANYVLRARIEFERIFDAAGAEWPLWALRAGDRITMRNLPPTLSADIDNIGTFLVGQTGYDAETDKMDVEPETAVPTLVTLVAQPVTFVAETGVVVEPGVVR